MALSSVIGLILLGGFSCMVSGIEVISRIFDPMFVESPGLKIQTACVHHNTTSTMIRAWCISQKVPMGKMVKPSPILRYR